MPAPWMGTISIPPGYWQVTLQALPTQSWFMVHFWPGWQAGHVVPPQSMSVSNPFFTPSLHEGGLQVPDGPQILSAQSDPSAHFLPSAQGMQLPPPQSTSV